MSDSYYDILELRRRASQDEIRIAYRRLARRYHPDHNPDDDESEERFKAVAEAYRVLSDPAARRLYDLSGIPPRGSHYVEAGSTIGVGDFFRRAGAAARRTFRSEKGRDLVVETELSFEEAWRGCRRVFELPRAKRPDADEPEIVRRHLEFSIPAGTHDGQKLRWPNEGAPGRWGGAPGDLYVRASVLAHPYLEIVEGDVVATIPTWLSERIDGVSLTLKLPDFEQKVTISAGTPAGHELRYTGRGPLMSGKRGDLIVRVMDLHPTGALSDAQRDALRTFEMSLKDDELPPGRHAIFSEDA